MLLADAMQTMVDYRRHSLSLLSWQLARKRQGDHYVGGLWGTGAYVPPTLIDSGTCVSPTPQKLLP